MNKEKINEIKNMFPDEKPICFNYQKAKDAVLELIDELPAEINQNEDMHVPV